MDPRHVGIIFDILAAWPFQAALELGSYNGASSTAFVEAINVGSPMTATFCDIYPRASLWDVVRNCKSPDRVRVTKDPSWDVLASFEHFDFVLVDAYHDAEPVAKETELLLTRRPLCIMAHDTNATAAGYEKCEGSRNLKAAIKSLPGYHGERWYGCIEDCVKREGERTERGLFFATTDQRLYEVGKRAFRKWCN
jgi:predicted O-methyltransferase YrrM